MSRRILSISHARDEMAFARGSVKERLIKDEAPASRVPRPFFPPYTPVVLGFPMCTLACIVTVFFDGGRTSRQPPLDGLSDTVVGPRLASDTGHCITRDAGTTPADALIRRSGREADFRASQVNGPSRRQRLRPAREGPDCHA